MHQLYPSYPAFELSTSKVHSTITASGDSDLLCRNVKRPLGVCFTEDKKHLCLNGEKQKDKKIS